MIDTEVLERTLHAALRNGGDFAEVFVEDRTSSNARLDDGKIEELVSGRARGAGVLVVRGESTRYAHTGMEAPGEASDSGCRTATTEPSPNSSSAQTLPDAPASRRGYRDGRGWRRAP